MNQENDVYVNVDYEFMTGLRAFDFVSPSNVVHEANEMIAYPDVGL